MSTRIDLNVIDQICKVLGVGAGDLFEYVEIEEKPKKEVKSKKR